MKQKRETLGLNKGSQGSQAPTGDDLAALRELVRDAALDASEEAVMPLLRAMEAQAESIQAMQEKLDAITAGLAMLLEEDMPEPLPHIDLAGRPIE